MKKILFLQPSYAHYREDLFALLSKRHTIHFLFEMSQNTYPGEKKPTKISCDFIDKKFKNNLIGLLYYLFKNDFDIVVSSVSFSKRTIISFLYAAIFRKKFILWVLQWKKAAYKRNGIKKIIKNFRYSIARQIMRRSHTLIVGGTAARSYALNLGIKEKNIFTAFQCSKDINEQDDGPAKSYCFNLTESLNVSDVEFIGSIIPDRTKDIYKHADVFVLPSRELDGYHEDWGLVVNEAMSMKLPVITTTAVGASYDMIINGHNGFIVKESSVEELYHAMNNILNCDLIQMGNISRKIFEEKNNYIKMANGFSAAIDHVVKQFGPSSRDNGRA
jgi:glycosyltransferase involved in cell wall biosynthesis